MDIIIAILIVSAAFLVITFVIIAQLNYASEHKAFLAELERKEETKRRREELLLRQQKIQEQHKKLGVFPYNNQPQSKYKESKRTETSNLSSNNSDVDVVTPILIMSAAVSSSSSYDSSSSSSSSDSSSSSGSD